MIPTEPVHALTQDLTLRISRRQFRGLRRDGNELHVKHCPAAPVRQRPDEVPRQDLLKVFRGDSDGRAENQTPIMQGVHAGDQLVIDPGAPPPVRLDAVAFDAQHGDQIPPLIQQIEIACVQTGSVGEDRKQDVLHLSCRLHHVPPQHGFAAGQEDKADAQLFSLTEDVFPLVSGELTGNHAVHRGLIAPGIASRAVEIAAGGDACDQKGRHMQALTLLGRSALLRLG